MANISLSTEKEERSILLHTCCGRCTTYVLKRLREEGFQVTGFWYNPNIHPYLEHERRREAMLTYAQKVELPMIIYDGYEMPLYLREVVGEEAGRCEICYRMRLKKAAQTAKEHSFPRFTTTLLISIYQDRDLIKRVGEEAAREKRVEFLYEDFSHGWQEHYELSQEAGIYKQKYCGCIYSEWERCRKKGVKELLEELGLERISG